jgi:predicted RND superfamily exporter protein
MDQVQKFQDALRDHPDVLHVRTYLDYLPKGMPHSSAQKVLSTLRKDSTLKYKVKEVINQDGKWASVIVRTNDMGTKRAGKFKDWIEEISIRHLGTDFEVQVVGQWWLAQSGMMNILSDMLWSFTTACILILPIMALLLRSIRLFLVSLLPNLLPMLAALAFMAAVGISVRIGTAMILAIALGIAIDDTIHLMIHLREHNAAGKDPREIVWRTLAQTGKAILYTSVVLVIGFGSMISNELMAIQDMGIVAAVTIIIALIADLYLAPALYLLSFGVLKKDGS